MLKKKIVVDARMINNSGIGVYIENLVKGLILSEKYNVVVIGVKDEVERKIYTHIKYEIINVNLPIYSVKEQIYMSFIIPRCDVFWSPHYNVPLLPILARKRLVTIHDTYHLAYRNKLKFLEVMYARLLLNSAVRISNKVFTDSYFSKQEIIKYTSCLPDKIDVVYVGIDSKRFRKVLDEAVKKKVTDILSLPDNFLLFVGNVKPNKNLVRLLEAFLSLLHKYTDIKLLIVGKREGFITGDERVYELLEKNQNLKTRVHFTGYVSEDDLPIIYNLASMLVFPSIYEGFGLPPLEAMACECPVVVSSAASIPEVCGEAGQYVDPFNVSSISEGIDLVLSDQERRSSLISLGTSRVKKFSWSAPLRKIMAVIDTI